MALLRHGTVKFTDSQIDNAGDTDGLMTLAHPNNPEIVPVYFCAFPFLLDSYTVREIVGSAAIMKPQPVSVIIDDQTHEQQPDLMLSIQAYCIHNDDVINLETIEIASDATDSSDNDMTLIVGSEKLLHSYLDSVTAADSRTIIYFPDNIQDQLTLSNLLELDAEHSVVPVISTGTHSFRDDQPHATALIRVLEAAIAHDAQLFHWIEGNASQLATQHISALSPLLTQYLGSEPDQSLSFLHGDEEAISTLNELAKHQLLPEDINAILVLIKTHVSVLNGLLPEGANARVWQLLSTLGHTLYFNDMVELADSASDQLFSSYKSTLLNAIGESTSLQSLEREHVEAAMLWLDEQNKLQIK